MPPAALLGAIADVSMWTMSRPAQPPRAAIAWLGANEAFRAASQQGARLLRFDRRD